MDRALHGQIRTLVQEKPWRIGLLRGLWRDGARGDRLDRARQDALRAARRGLRSKHPAVVAAAAAVFDAAGDDRQAEAARSRRAALLGHAHDPDAGELAGHRVAIQRAGQVLDPRAGLANLDGLAETLPDSGDLRRRFELERRSLLERIGDEEGAYEALRAAWRADDSDADTANSFAYDAALRGDDLEEALEAVDRAIESVLTAQRGSNRVVLGQGLVAWLDGRSSNLGSYLDTRAWLLYRLDRWDDAHAAIQEALLHQPRQAVLLMHAGLILVALGEDRAAAEYLADGLSRGDGGEPELAAVARAALQERWSSVGLWHPGGVDGYLDSRRSGRAGRGADAGPRPARPDHPLLGELLSDLELHVEGESARLADFEGIRVVDLWATWCGPCVESMPHLDEVARTYADRGVTVLAVSVDQAEDVVVPFFEGIEPAYTVAWSVDDAMAELRVRGIPAVFVVDVTGVIVEQIQGYGGEEDTRIEAALDAILGE